MTPWTIQSINFSRSAYWSGLPFPSPGDLPNPGIKPRSPTLQADYLPAEPQEKPKSTGVSSLSLLQRIFPTQELNQGLLRCRWILYQLSCQGSPNLFKRHILIVSHILCLAMGTLIQTLSLGCLESYGNDYIRFLVKGFVVWFYVKYSNFTSRKLG